LKLSLFIPIVSLLLLLSQDVVSQSLSNVRQRYIPLSTDTVQIDSLSMVPGTWTMYLPEGGMWNDTVYTFVDVAHARLIVRKRDETLPDSVLMVYRVFPLFLTQTYRNRDRGVIEKSFSGLYNPYSYDDQTGGQQIFRLEGLQRNGNISRGVSFGNNQDVVVNSSFNLQLSGKLSDDVEILASITDNNIPVQPEGNTQQIQDFDKVFIQLSKNKTKLIAGDFELRRPESYFMNFYKKGQGGVLSSEYLPGTRSDQVMRTTVSGAVSKGKYARNVINGQEANQGPYRLTGSSNEAFIIVLSGTEQVFIDGVPMTRGEQNDYVIDYNTAEIRFTAKRPITKDKRIVVEFQYSDKNYTRTMYFISQEYEDARWKVKANIFSEQDAKNQPLLQDLSDEEKMLLANVGDSITQAFSPNIDSVAFNSNEVLYARIDSAGYTFYRYSTDSTLAHFRLGFSFVGANKGNYNPISSTANGRVYQWIEPVNGVPQGSYEPVTLLISPKKQQLFTLGADYKLRGNRKVFAEAAYSVNDANLFSDKDKSNDGGYAFAGGVEQLFNLSSDTVQGWKLQTILRLEHVNEQFAPLESYRPIEFTRDWNLQAAPAEGDENAAGLQLRLIKPGQLIGYHFRTFLKGNDYRGLMNSLNARVTAGGFNLVSDVSLLNAENRITGTLFLRSSSDLSRPVGRIIIGGRYEQERNEISNTSGDTLRINSFSYDVGKIYFTSVDTAKIRFRIDLSRRYDYGVRNDAFKRSTEADEAAGRIEFTGNPKSRLSISSNYRKLTISDTILTAVPPEESLLNRIEYTASIWKGFASLNTFYEAGTGQELKREYAFLEVAPGTGVYAYAGDYNNNGVKDLDEFEISPFPDLANFVKIFLPTNEYVKTRTNQFNQSITLSPAAVIQQREGWKKLLSRFASQTSYRVDNKTLEKDLLRALNPFDVNIDNDILIASNSAFRNTLSYNRSSTVYSIDVTYLDNQGKTILTNGFESRMLQSWVTNGRWNITRVYSIQATNETGSKQNRSEILTNRNYDISFITAEPRFSIQPSVAFRVTLLYKYVHKENSGGELSEQHTIGTEIKYSPVNKGIFTVKFNLIEIGYNASENSPIAYEILEGLRSGRNYTWGATIQRSLSNSIQVNLNYEGRKPEGTKTIHVGSVQARAFF
jgi:hypothetical protein